MPCHAREDGCADQDHAGAQELSHAERPENKAELRIGLAGELDQEPHHSVPHEECAGKHPLPVPFVSGRGPLEPAERDEEHQPFPERLVQLRRVA